MANTQTTATNLPSWVTGPTQTALGDIQSWLKSPQNYVYGSKKGEKLFTPLTTSQNEAIGNANWMADQNLRKLLGFDKAEGMWDAVGSAAPSTLTGSYKNAAGSGLGTERLVDEKGFLGKISDYINPYIQQVLDPQIRNMNEQLQIGRRDLGANELMSGAFGDARHGVEESQLYDDTQKNIGDATGAAYANAFNTAMGLRSGDIGRKDAMELAKAGYAEGDVNRLLQKDQFNAQANEAALARKAQNAQAVTDIGQLFFKNFNDTNDALFNAGKIQRDAQEEQRQAMEKFQTAIKDKRFNDALKMLGALQGTATPTESTTTTKSNDGLMGVLGALLGGIL